jgi:hypothetical protein
MPSELPDPLEVALTFARALERVGVAYFLGGSLASSLQGEPRATNDIDFVVDLNAGQVPALENELGPEFDVDGESLVEAARTRGSWNIFHLPTMTKIDLFIRRESDFDESEFTRRGQVEVRPGRRLYVKSAEDTVVRKLLWYQQGGEQSNTQWRDILEVLRVSGPSLDWTYLEQWAERLGISALLVRARGETR